VDFGVIRKIKSQWKLEKASSAKVNPRQKFEFFPRYPRNFLKIFKNLFQFSIIRYAEGKKDPNAFKIWISNELWLMFWEE